MFHRPRPLNLHPAQTPEMMSDDSVSSPVLVSESGAEAISASSTSVSPTVSSTLSQPEQKEAQPMSTFTVPIYNNTSSDTSSSEQQTTSSAAPASAPQMPTSASYTNQTAVRPSSTAPAAPQPFAARSPYSYGNSFGPDASISTGRKLVIGEGISLSGEIEACDHLVVEGTVEASLKGASVLDVSQSGMFFGSVEINEATIAGRFEGNLVVNGRLTVRSTGTISGTLSYKELAVEAGATIEGSMAPMSADGRSTSSDKKASGSSSKKSSDSSELPFSKSQAA